MQEIEVLFDSILFWMVEMLIRNHCERLRIQHRINQLILEFGLLVWKKRVFAFTSYVIFRLTELFYYLLFRLKYLQ